MSRQRTIAPRLIWLWVIPLLLIAAVLGGVGLNKDAYTWDEVSSMNAVGGTTPGLSLTGTWERVTALSPDQAVGFALLLSVWGRLVGWTEFATRTLPFFAGLLALAWVYRAGRDLFSPHVGVFAVAILATSVYFVAFLHYLRIFTMVALVVAVTLWAYWRVILHPRPPGIAPQIALALGSIALFYTHYFATLFLGALGLYHLLFARKTRRWWIPVIAMALAAIVFLPEFQVFLSGISRNADRTQLHEMAISPPEIVYDLLYFFGNGSILLVVIAASGLLIAIRRRLYTGESFYLLFLTLATLLLIIGANEILKVLTHERVRYLMPLWPLLALGVGFSIWQFRHMTYRLAIAGIVVWAVFGVWRNVATTLADEMDPPELPWREMRHDLQTLGSPDGDVFLFHGVPSRIREFYVASTIPMRREIIESWDTDDNFRTYIEDAQRVWIGTDWRGYAEFGIDWAEAPEFHNFIALLDDEGFVFCDDYIDHPYMRLDLYARSSVFCPNVEPRLRFGDGITLGEPTPATLAGDRLSLDALWTLAPDVPADTYSVAVHIYDADTESFIKQADYGLPPGPAGPVHTEIDLGDLPDGRYNLIVGIYDWQTGTRLPGSDLETGAQGDLLPLATFTLDE
jgi:hypothetical protein